MNKEDFVWVGIRIFGIYLLVLAVLALPSLVQSLVMVTNFSDHPALNTSEIGTAMGSMDRTIYWNHVGASIGTSLYLIVCTVFGLYFLRHGQFVFRLASRPLDGEDRVVGPPEDE